MAATKNASTAKDKTIWTAEIDRKLLLYLLPDASNIDKDAATAYMGITKSALQNRLFKLRQEHNANQAGTSGINAPNTSNAQKNVTASAAAIASKKTPETSKIKAKGPSMKRKSESDEEDEKSAKKKLKAENDDD